MSRNPPSPVWSRNGTIDRVFARLLPAAGIGSACYLAYGLLFEQFFMPALRRPGEPMLSYGQQAGLMMLPAAILGTAIGLVLLWRTWIARGIAVVAPLLVAKGVNSLWNESLAQYGPDPSDQVLYVPILAGAPLCLAIVVILIVVQSLRSARGPLPRGLGLRDDCERRPTE